MAIDLLSGMKFGRYLVQSRADNKKGQAHWNCICDCGNERVVNHYNLKKGSAKSCGCLRNEKFIERITKHSLASHPLYQAYYDMRTRCYNPKSQRYDAYGKRGIVVCDRWTHPENGFLNFCDDMQPTWQKGLTIDRKEVNGNYEPDNCKWSTKREQAQNKRTNRMIETPWGTLCLQEASRRANLSRSAISLRIDAGWPQERWFDPPGTRLNRRD